ncbi:MAG: YgiQ family radical SAM protein [Bacteroidetes bacterium GWA2_30_7]|nr:MAG: YgiQ family radical SAM protein [Bacteroidetes bacterium GWA2_30_7]
MNKSKFLPTTAKEAKELGWNEVDVVLFSGDAYIDHPSFGVAVIARILEHDDYKVAVVPQPNWQDDLRDFKKFGTPHLFFGVTAGNMDSMINHYTANIRLRSDDAYTPGGKAGFRPDYPTIVYSKILKKLFPDVPVIIGGIEASMRRYTHYDYWQNKLKNSILIDSEADLLLYGMSEKSISEVALKLNNGISIQEIRDIPQTAFKINKSQLSENKESITLHSHQECVKSKIKYAENFKLVETESNKIIAKQIVQTNGDTAIVVNPPYYNLTQSEIDIPYDLPYTRLPHPKYKNKGDIPAYEMIKHSVNIHRGCFGGCSFCTISMHQGKFIQSRSEKSIINEINEIVKLPDFKGYLSDVGGPSANMYNMKGLNQQICNKCTRPSCIHPEICKNLNTNHEKLIELYRKIRKIPEIKKAFVGSGIRYDLFINNNNCKYFEELVTHHVSGRLKVAPEHSSEKVLKLMRKTPFADFVKLKRKFEEINKAKNLKQQLIPYFISSHPESTTEDMAELAVKTKELGYRLEQVQDFTPTPMTLSTVIFYTGINPYTGKEVYTAKSIEEKKKQQKFFFWYKREFKNEIIAELKKIGKVDFIKKLFN